MTRTQPPAPDMSPRENTLPLDPAALDIPHPRPFTVDLRTSEHELSGTIEHVSNVEYVRWLDRAAELHADSLGYTRAEMLKRGLMWFVARHEIDYRAESWREDQLLVLTWIREVRRVKCWRDYVIVRPSDGTIICRAATLWVLVDLESRKPRRMSETMIARFDALPDAIAPATVR